MKNHLDKPDCSLPFVHVTSWSSALRIFRDGYLKPNSSDVFKEDILYMSYGKIVYEPSLKPYTWVDDLPVAFVFRPHLINKVFDFYPFDTGAVVAGHLERYTSTIEKYLNLFKMNNGVKTRPSTWIKSFFGSNNIYLLKTKSNLPKKQKHICEAFEYLYDSYESRADVDQRLVSIECQFKGAVGINMELDYVWVHKDYKKMIDKKGDCFNFNRHKIRYYGDYSIDGSIPLDLRKSVDQHIINAALTSG